MFTSAQFDVGRLARQDSQHLFASNVVRECSIRKNEEAENEVLTLRSSNEAEPPPPAGLDHVYRPEAGCACIYRLAISVL